MGQHRAVTGNEGRGCFIAIAVLILLFILTCIVLAVTA